jgi:aryl-alcohol dehydrogenase-like predicted oxidoreductase
MEACDASLKRLGVDYIDLYQCHRYDPETPVDEVVLAMDDLARRGKILYWGVSVWSGEQIRHALAESDRYLAHRPVSNQPPYSLLNRGIEAEVLPVSRAEGLGQLVFSPLAQGLLTGKYAQGRIPEGSRAADENRNRFLKPLMTDENLEKARRLAELARGMDVTPAQLALAWCLRDPIVSGAIIGATEPGQVRENAKAAELKVPGDVLAQLDEIFPGSDPPDQP